MQRPVNEKECIIFNDAEIGRIIKRFQTSRRPKHECAGGQEPSDRRKK